MDRRIQSYYDLATPFDESDLALSVDYEKAMRRLLDAQRQIEQRFGPEAAAIAEDLLDSTYEVTGLETMHFFQEGYRAALLDNVRAPLQESECPYKERRVWEAAPYARARMDT